MGFGTLFIGYFLLLNITYFTITDVIAALIMALGLYKLQTVNKYYKGGFFIALFFSVIGLFELCIEIYGMFDTAFNSTSIISYASIPRYITLAVLCCLILLGNEDVSKEVGLFDIAKKNRLAIIPTTLIYAVLAMLEIPGIEVILDIKVIAIASVICLAATFIMTIINLTSIYGAYMKICMPDEKEFEDKPSRFEFVNKYRKHTAEKQKEYAEYKIEKMKKKNSKKKRK